MTLSQRLAGLLLALSSLAAWAQSSPPLTILAPTSATTERDFVNVLGRTSPGSSAQIQGAVVPVYGTGVFVRDRVPLQPGANLLRVEVRGADGQVTTREWSVERVLPSPPPPPPADALFIDTKSVQPAQPLRLLENEAFEVGFSGAPGRLAEVRLPGTGQRWQPMAELTPGRYSASLRLRGSADVAAAPVQFRLSLPKGQAPARRAPRTVQASSAGDVGLWHSEQTRLVQVGGDGANLTWGLHEVRLGGPNLAELPRGTRLRITGQRGDRLRVALAPDVEAWVAASEVEALPAGTPLPRPVFTNLSVTGGDGADIVTIPWPATLPIAARSVTVDAGRSAIELDLFGSHHATTWITHRANRRVVREASVEQPARERLRVRLELDLPQPWGWRIERDTNSLRVVVRHPPALDAAAPLKGLVVAVEAGHGGPTNLGAIGATGTPEKDINRWTADALQAELEAAGARVVVVREGDQNPTLRERAQRVTESGAQVFVSVHANASDVSGGYLRAKGISTYYKHPHGRDLAAAVQRQLLADTALPDFGLVGNFNYAPIRLVTWMPSVLVEQAFVSNPEEEALLLDAGFRARLARAVRLGLEQHLRDRAPRPTP